MTQLEKKAVGTNIILSNEVVQLFKSASVETASQAFTVLFHSFLIESGFDPKDVSEDEKFKHMPDNWNGKNLSRIIYSHSYCPSFTCCMTCVPLYQTISIRGTLIDKSCPESVTIQVQMQNYIKEKKYSGSIEGLKNLNELSLLFKDGFCLPLLNLLSETAGSPRLFGLPGMVDEMKIYMLKYLPVKDVVSMSAVNKKFYLLANLPELWKYMFLRDFSKGGISDVDSSSAFLDWKQRYKQEYLKKKPIKRERRYPRYLLEPDDIDLHTGFPQIIPDPFEPGPFLFPPMLPPRLPPFFRRLM